MNISIREPAVAGLFYPEDPATCRNDVAHYLALATPDAQAPRPKAVIVPHAGYIYSAGIAASAYKIIEKYADSWSRVLLLGPSHRVPLRGMAVPASQRFRTPLGDIALDVETIKKLTALPEMEMQDLAHEYEHSLEVQLPFLQSVLHDFKLIPVVVGDASATAVAELISQFWQRDDTLIVVSSDLSHYLDYASASETDAKTAQLIEQKSDHLHGEQACGCRAINGLMRCATANGAQVRCIDLKNSGDTAGDRSRVVGYGAFIVY